MIGSRVRVAGQGTVPPAADHPLPNNGKGYRERTVYAMNGGRQAIDAWIALRGDAPGPLLAPVGQTGAIDVRPMTAQALMMRLRRRAKAANISHCPP